MFVFVTFAVFFLNYSSSAVNPKCDVSVRLESGWVCGRLRHAEGGTMYASYRGIPYATQPLGPLRFKELEPVQPWDDAYDATEEGPICPQYDEIHGHLLRPMKGMSEACISANVHVPVQTVKDPGPTVLSPQNSSLPILVFVNGIGWQAGSGDSDLFGPEYLVSQRNIVITFNFRINVFGFLSLNTAQMPGNAGLRDIITLLRWVKRNARSFGGDPDNVTLGGQSTGSSSVHLLSVSNAAKGLFKRIIMMSGHGLPAYYTPSPAYAKQTAERFMQYLGINSTDPEYIYKQLIYMPLDRIMDAYRVFQLDSGLVAFVPVVEDEFPGVTRVLDDDPVRLIAEGRGKYLPLLLGFTDGECETIVHKLNDLDVLSGFQQNPGTILATGISFNLSPEQSRRLGDKVIQRYFNGTMTMDQYIDCCTDTIFAYSTFKIAQWRAQMGAAPVYLYQFFYESSYNLVKHALSLRPDKRSGHFEDLTCMFRENAMLGDYKTFPPRNRDDLMRYTMTTFVSNFMRCSSPTCSNPAAWPPVNASALNYQAIRNPVRLNSNTPATQEEQDMVLFYDHIWREAKIMSNEH